MKQDVLVWKESIYKRNFVCDCGIRLMKDNGEVEDILMVEPTSERPAQVICGKCLSHVANLELKDIPDEWVEPKDLEEAKKGLFIPDEEEGESNG